MTGYKPNMYWKLTWGIIAPLVMGVSWRLKCRVCDTFEMQLQCFCSFQFIFCFYVFSWKPVKYGDVEYPTWAHILGFIMSMSSMLWIPGYAIYYLATETGSFQEVKHYSDWKNLPQLSNL